MEAAVPGRGLPRGVRVVVAVLCCALAALLGCGLGAPTAVAATRPPPRARPINPARPVRRPSAVRPAVAGRAVAAVRPVAGTPCTSAAMACVDLAARRAWLLRNGKVARGPVPISIGGPGEETPVGVFRVWFKDRDHHSAEQHGTPMPYSVFFDRGVAFHGGPLDLASAGCVHLTARDAAAFFTALRVGDQVQVRARGPVRPSPARPEVRPQLHSPARQSARPPTRPSGLPSIGTAPPLRPAAELSAGPPVRPRPGAAPAPRRTRRAGTG
jgi:hypothetical protein